jgi:ankyrin repeat protein
MTALHIAASHPHCADASDELVRALLDAGADSDAVDGERMKPIHAAAAVGRVGVVETLLERTTRDDGVAEGDWNASGVQKIVQVRSTIRTFVFHP